uniref:Phytanoyl-CoA dioxygenase n=1 Tax=Helicotheca tamesis TaxID=374047 RepID=A0A7S2IG43_9STRA|mmetsp:Transcript_9090/g.12607  ORF Transcript_9090/g.12607 Transcript_9090/m.12607 type:complete len:329 (+) Transcript_9090:67-1053(+)
MSKEANKKVSMRSISARFDYQDASSWLDHLKTEGFIVIKQALCPGEVQTAIDLFWTHIENELPKSNRSKADGDEKPIDRNDITTWLQWRLDKRGFMTGKTAQSKGSWYVRGIPRIHDIFAKIWDEEDLLVSMDAVIAWKPWWHHSGWIPLTEGLHLDQNPFNKRDFVCVQGMVPLYDVTTTVGGLEVVPQTHTEESKDEFRKRYPQMSYSGDWCPLRRKDPLQGCGSLVLAQAGDLILWDSRTVHGGVVGTGEIRKEDKHKAQLARLSIPVCMTPRSWASKEVLQQRKEAFETGACMTHWPHEVGDGHSVGTFANVPIDLTKEQLKIL